jgi:hypothetical protein
LFWYWKGIFIWKGILVLVIQEVIENLAARQHYKMKDKNSPFLLKIFLTLLSLCSNLSLMLNMMKKEEAVLSIAGILFLLIAAFAGGMYFCSVSDQESASPPVPAETQEAETKLYTNERLRFSIEYSPELNDIQEIGNKVVFHIKGENRSGFGVLTERVPFNTTEEWLDAQPRGSLTSLGIEENLWLDRYAGGIGTALISQYVVVDYDGDGPIYGKGLYAVRVNNGILYKIPLSSS